MTATTCSSASRPPYACHPTRATLGLTPHIIFCDRDHLGAGEGVAIKKILAIYKVLQVWKRLLHFDNCCCYRETLGSDFFGVITDHNV